MTWPVLAIISIVSVSIAILLERVLLEDEASDAILYAIVFQFLLGVIAFILTILFGSFSLPDLTLNGGRFLLSATLWAGATVFSFQAMKRLSAGEVTILTTASSVVSIYLGVTFLHEQFTPLNIVGVLLVFVAVLLVQSDQLTFRSRKGIWFALLSAFCAGVAVVNDAVILRQYEAFSYTAVMSILPGVVLLLLFPGKLRQLRSLVNRSVLPLMVIFCVFYAIQAISYYLAFEAGAPVSLLSPMIKSSIVVTVVLAALFLHERNNLVKKMTAAIIVTVGAILLR